MSRNFELLQRLGYDEKALSRAAVAPAVRVTPVVAPLRISASTTPPDPHIDSIVQQLFTAPNGDVPTAVTFVSVMPTAADDLCARVARRLAAQTTEEVCLVDAGPEQPAVHKTFGLANDRGLADALADTARIRDFAIPIAGSGLSVLTAGNAARLPLGEPLAERVHELREQFACVLFRVPLLGQDATASFLGRLSGNAVLVVEAHATRRDTAVRVKSELERNGVNVIGAVLTNRTFPIPQSLYSKLF